MSVEVPSKRPRTDDQENEPPASRAKLDLAPIQDSDSQRRRERERQAALRATENALLGGLDKPKADPKVEMAKLANTRGGGTYIPPHRLKAMMAEQEAQDAASVEYQRMTWEALRKSINGLINKVNVANIKFIIPDLFGENLIRGKGLFCRSIMRAQAASLPYTPVFACLVAIVNSKLPAVGELLIHRLVVQLRRAYKRNDKPTCIATLTFLAHLCNQRVLAELIAMEVLQLLLDGPTDDSVELAVGFTREVGLLLQETAPKFNNALYEMYRDVLHSPRIDKRVQYMVEVLFQVRKDKFKDNPILPEGLDLVEDGDLITHRISLTDQVAVQDGLNIFHTDAEFEQHEAEYKQMRDEILGSDDGESGSDAGSESSDDDGKAAAGGEDLTGTIDIHDQTETNLVNLRRQIYLTIMSALDFQEAIHKLLKIELAPGQETELCNMVVECCSQERSYAKFYGSMGERLSKLNPMWSESFEASFKQYYTTIHRYESNRLRNIARFFGHLLGSDSIPWTVFEVIRLNEDDTTSSSRIFVKILFQEMVGFMGLPMLKDRFAEPSMQMYYSGMFPLDDPRNTRFSINYWTSIQMGALTETMREHLKSVPAQIAAQQQRMAALPAAASSDSSSSSDTTSSDSDSSDSEDDRRRRPASPKGARNGRKDSRSPPARRRRDSSTPPRRRSSPPRRRRDSRSPPPKRRDSPPRRRDDDSPPPRRRRSPSPVSRRRSPSPVTRRRPVSRSPSPVRGAPKSNGRARAADFYDERDKR